MHQCVAFQVSMRIKVRRLRMCEVTLTHNTHLFITNNVNVKSTKQQVDEQHRKMNSCIIHTHYSLNTIWAIKWSTRWARNAA